MLDNSDWCLNLKRKCGVLSSIENITKISNTLSVTRIGNRLDTVYMFVTNLSTVKSVL